MDLNDAATAARKTEIKLSDYRPPAFEIPTIDLTVRLEGGKATVTAKLTVRRRDPGADALWLDGSPHYEVGSVRLNGHVLADGAYSVHPHGVEVRDVPETFTLETVATLDAAANTRLEGLYQSNGTYCTQCEAEGFRHITPFLDRPDVLSEYTVRIEAEKSACPVLLSNGNPVENGELEDGWHYAVWQDPHKKPCYLFALVAGDLESVRDKFTTRDGRHVDLAIYVRSGDETRCDHAMWALKRSMEWEEERYGRSYDLDVYSIVAVSDFNMGAMENKGLNIFNTKYVLADPDSATDDDYDNVAGVIAHEYFHNWTGNRVTCRDWFQLSLKEGLTVFRDQQFSSDITSEAVKRLDDVRVLRALQFQEDASPLAHPVRPDRYVEINNFYTATVYNKGAEVIRMMHALLGEENFRAGMDLYFERHDGQAVTVEDFVSAMQDASGVDLGDFSGWYHYAGTPQLTVTCERDEQGNVIAIAFRQRTPATSGQDIKPAMVLPVRLALLDEAGGEVALEACTVSGGEKSGDVFVLREPEGRIEVPASRAAKVPSLLRGFSAPVKIASNLSLSDHLHLMRYDRDSFARWDAAQSAWSHVVGLAYDALAEQKEFEAPKPWVEVILSLVADHRLDPALVAEMVRPPNAPTLAQGYAQLNPVRLEKAVLAAQLSILSSGKALLLDRYTALTQNSFSLEQSAKAERRLRMVLLDHLCLEEELAPQLIRQLYKSAGGMTERINALSQASHRTDAVRCEILEHFHNQFQDNDLVMDKWFAVQAASRANDCLERVRDLTAHDAFTYKNPNRMRALIGTLTYRNLAAFHREDGEGYRLLRETIEAVDKLNPQSAARLVAPFGPWRTLEHKRADMVQQTLTQILDNAEVSDDVRELVSKSLAR